MVNGLSLDARLQRWENVQYVSEQSWLEYYHLFVTESFSAGEYHNAMECHEFDYLRIDSHFPSIIDYRDNFSCFFLHSNEFCELLVNYPIFSLM